MKAKTLITEWRRQRAQVPPLGEPHVIGNWIRDDDGGLIIDMHRYSQLLAMLPDKIATSLERARLERAGVGPMLRMGLGYEELLASIIADPSAIASSAAETMLAPALLLPANYLQPGGIPGRTLRLTARGRVTTLTTGATMTFKVGAATTNVVPTTTWAVSGAIVQDAAANTNTMWRLNCDIVVRSVGSAGTVFAMGNADMASVRFTSVVAADRSTLFMGSAGAATPAAATVDMTVGQYLSLTGTWSLSTAYSIQAHQMLLEALN